MKFSEHWYKIKNLNRFLHRHLKTSNDIEQAAEEYAEFELEIDSDSDDN